MAHAPSSAPEFGPLHRLQRDRLHEVVKRAMEAGVPEGSVRDKACWLLLDTLACILSGRRAPPLVAFERLQSTLGPGAFRFPGGPGVSASAASAIAAMATAWDEACEGLPYAHGRPALPVVAALLPLAVLRDDTLDSLLSALVAGYEAGARAGGWLRIRPGMHVDGNWPAIGVAAAVSRLIGLTGAQARQAIDIVGCQLPTSLYLPIRTGDNARNTYLAHTAQLGHTAALCAAAGITAPVDALLEYATQWSAYPGTPVPDVDRKLILESYFKPQAGVRHAHYGLQAAQALRARLHGRSDAITAIELRVYPEAATYAGNRDPQAAITAQFSVSLGVAAGLRFGEMTPELFAAPTLFDPELRRLEKLVVIHPDPELGHGGRRAAALSIDAAGERLQAHAEHIEGDPDQPLDPARIVDKFVRYSAPGVDASSARRFAEAILSGVGTLRLNALWSALL